MSSRFSVERGSVVSFTMISLALMSATLLALVHTAGRLFDAQIAQSAADASALACASSEQNEIESREQAAEMARRNGGELQRTEIKTDRCGVVVVVRKVARGSVAMSMGRDVVPILRM
ncbi:MAG: hypothetical protein ACKO92_05340 [Actinomycetota bacterium]